MTDPVRIHFGYFKIDTDVWVGQRIGDRHDQYTESLRDFASCGVFDDYWPAMDTSARMQLWCAARGWPVCEGSPVYHDDTCLTYPVTIVLASDAQRRAYAMIQIEGQSPVVHAAVTTDDGYWYQVQTVEIVCPSSDHCWTWLDGRNLLDIEGREITLAQLFGPGPHAPYERCRDCEAFDDRRSAVMCLCGGTAIYCPACGQRCRLTLPDIPTHPDRHHGKEESR